MENSISKSSEHPSNKTSSSMASKDNCTDSTSQSERQEARIGEAIAKILTEIIEDNESLVEANKPLQGLLSSFTYKKPPGVSIDAYLQRILKYTKLEYSTLVLCLIYLDRVCERNNIIMTKYNIHRLLLASIVTAIKYNEDDYFSNSFYSRVGGISLQEINLIEADFIRLSDFILFVDETSYEKYRVYLMAYHE